MGSSFEDVKLSVLSDMEARVPLVFSANAETLVTFHRDGRIELSPNASPSEAARAMFDLLEPMLRALLAPESPAS